jgi:hypothetical protein
MGAWDETVFGNDDAADFAGEISEVKSFAEVVDRLSSAFDNLLNSDGYLDNYVVNSAVVAGALVAAWDNPELLPGTPYEPENWPPFDQPLPAELRVKAARAIDRALTGDDNEYVELWAETDSWDKVVADVQRYRSALP